MIIRVFKLTEASAKYLGNLPREDAVLVVKSEHKVRQMFIDALEQAIYERADTKPAFDAIGGENAQPALAFATACLLGLAAAFALAIPRRVVTYREFFACVPAGIRMMVPALVILALAWTLSAICNGLLGIDAFISAAVKRGADAGVLPLSLLPAAMFLLAAAVSFSTGTSWGTFGILIPISVAVCGRVDPSLNVLALSSILSGGVMGDHCSPISDTTILSSTGSQCRHIDHVRTQLPYALVVGAASFAGYAAAGLSRPLGYGVSACVALAFSGVLLAAALVALPRLFPAPAAGTASAEEVPAEAKAWARPVAPGPPSGQGQARPRFTAWERSEPRHGPGL